MTNYFAKQRLLVKENVHPGRGQNPLDGHRFIMKYKNKINTYKVRLM